jgi:hypothetical protein
VDLLIPIMAQPLPRPETLAAFLPSGLGKAPSVHLYVRTEKRDDLVTETPGKAAIYVSGHVFIFRCTETGIERVWGCQ